MTLERVPAPDFDSMTDAEIDAYHAEEVRKHALMSLTDDTPWLIKAVERAAQARAMTEIMNNPQGFKLHGFRVDQMLIIVREVKKLGVHPSMNADQIREKLRRD